jgi:uncharacterized protein (TIGR03437 family)
MRANETRGRRLKPRIARYLAGAVVVFLPAWCQAQTTFRYTITTVAGTGASGYSGDGGQATSAQLSIPWGIAVDASGNLYIADEINNRIRMVAADGTITTIAGNGTSGYTGDGSAATSAELNYPAAVAVDGSGNVYIADTANHVVRKRAAGGTIANLAGTNVAGYAGDGAAATSAQLNLPLGVALDTAGNLYIADTLNSMVRKVATGGTITTVAGSTLGGYGGDGGAATSAQLYEPFAVTVDAAGNLYLSDTFNHAVRKVAVDGTITTVAGSGTRGYSGDGGLATQAKLNYPAGLAVDAAGNLYIADSLNCRIRVVTPSGIITTVAGTGKFGSLGDGGPATSAQLNTPTGVALDSAGKLYVADSQNSRVRRLTPDKSATPSMQPGAVISASGFGAFTSAAPGSWIEIYGSNLATNTRQWRAADFNGVNAPTSLDGTSVTIGGQAAFVGYISPTQVNAVAPSNAGTGPQQITVTTAAGISAPYTLNFNATEPGLWAPPSFKIGGKSYVGALFSDFATFALPSGAIPGVNSRPAHPGETIILYGTGFGAVTPSVNAGEVTQQTNALVTPIQVFFGGMAAQVAYAGLAPTTVGLYQFNVVVPNVAASDAVPLTFSLGGAAGLQTLYIAVQN